MNDPRSATVKAELRPAFAGPGAGSLLQIDAWVPSEITAISPLVERLMRLIEGSRCITGQETAVELALREALNNAVVHGNRLDAHKLVHVRCRCKVGKGISITVSDQGQGFDPSAVPNPLSVNNLEAELRQLIGFYPEPHCILAGPGPIGRLDLADQGTLFLDEVG